MRDFGAIYAIASERKGGDAALEAMLTRPAAAPALAALPDDRWLSAMARAIFQAGFSWKVIDAKWPGFDAAFEGFLPSRIAHYHDLQFDRLLADKGIVRNPQKIRAVMDNAVWLDALARAHGSAASVFADWPETDTAGLLSLMAKDGARLGGTTGQRVLRSMGKSSFVLSPSVTARLIAEGVIDKPASSKRAMDAVQQAFNTWCAQSDRSLTEVSQVLALSIDAG